jgi:hypothetical protein
VQVGLWCCHARAWGLEAELVGSIIVTCGRPAALVVNTLHHSVRVVNFASIEKTIKSEIAAKWEREKNESGNEG